MIYCLKLKFLKILISFLMLDLSTCLGKQLYHYIDYYLRTNRSQKSVTLLFVANVKSTRCKRRQISGLNYKQNFYTAKMRFYLKILKLGLLNCTRRKGDSLE
eukprot:NODE_380_length_8387_cov_0.529440.p7 type:complete len:102 gc:universal NODE_380_length_8387_cov_0.529440:6296-6601(+)